MNHAANHPEGLGSLLRSLVGRLDPVVEERYREQVPTMRARFYPVLRALAGKKARSVSDLARAARVSQPAMTQTLAQMRKVDLVVDEADQKDGRARVFRLSDAGLAAMETLAPTFEDIAYAVQILEVEIGFKLTEALIAAHRALDANDMNVRLERLKS